MDSFVAGLNVNIEGLGWWEVGGRVVQCCIPLLSIISMRIVKN